MSRLPMLPYCPSGRGEIPRTLHQVWVGSAPPAWVRRTWNTWDEFMAKHHPDWTIRRWTDRDVPHGPLGSTLRAATLADLSPRGTADLLRLHAVSLFGGLYFDTDTVPLLPLDRYVGIRPGWIGTAERTRDSRTLANASFGFPAGDPFLERVWGYANLALGRGVVSDSYIAGPHTWRREWDKLIKPPEVDYSFANEWDRDLQKTMGAAQPFDLDALRQRFPGVPVLHVVWFARVEGLLP